MASFSSIPVELQRLCIRDADIDTLRNLRLASRSASVVGAEKMFETVILRFTEISAKKLVHVLNDHNLRLLVKQVIINGEEGDRRKEQDEETGEMINVTVPWSLAIPRISEFPSLKELEFRLASECSNDREYGRYYKQTTEYRTHYHDLFVRLLAHASLVDCLTFKNIQDATITTTGPDGAFATIQQRLQRLALMVVTETKSAAPEYDIEEEAFQDCFNYGLFHWLEYPNSQLTHLTLYCDAYWGVNPFTDLRRVQFAKLKSLALGNWTIAHDWQIDWITSHGDKLEQLVLDDCPIAIVLQMSTAMADKNWPEMCPSNGWRDNVDGGVIKTFPTRWSDVFPVFRQKLPYLKQFGMGHGDWHRKMFTARYELPARIESSRYICYQDGYGPSPWVEDLDCEFDGEDPYVLELEDDYGNSVKVHMNDEEQDAKDEEALDELLRAIGKTQDEIERMKDLN